MSGQVIVLAAALAAGALGFVLVVVAGYRWGVYVASTAMSTAMPKWKAYLLSITPPAGFALTFLLDSTLAHYAQQTFMVLATPALIGTCLRINQSRYSTF